MTNEHTSTAEHQHPISGIYDIGIGVTNADEAIRYWQQFGYHVGERGQLDAATAQQLYRVDSTLQSIRLFHQQADHGLIRLMVWDRPTNPGLGLAPMKSRGNRWITAMTTDIVNLWNHAEVAASRGADIHYVPPQWTVIYPTPQGQPFFDPLIGVREMLLIQPYTRQVLFQRFNYTVSNYGNIHPSSTFATSQATHMGLVVQDDSKESLRFYDQVLGLLRSQDDLESTYETAKGGRPIFDLQPGEKFIVTSFDDPRSSATDWQAARSGRLYIVRFPETMDVPDYATQSRPGCLGVSLYTYRVTDLDAYWQRLQTSNAQQVTDITTDEFGDRSFSFVAPDGYFWTLMAR